MNLVDSSAWLEYFADGPNARYFAAAIEDTDALVVSSINLYEVFKRIVQQRGESAALQAVAIMEQGKLVNVDEPIALRAVRLSIDHRLPMADSLILATAQASGAILWTQDVDFAQVDGVRYRAKPASA